MRRVDSGEQLKRSIVAAKPQSLHYEADYQTFIIGDTTIPLGIDFKRGLWEAVRTPPHLTLDTIGTAPLVMTSSGDLFGLPKLHDGLKPSVLDETAGVMRTAYESLYEEDAPPSIFEALIENMNSSFTARVLGAELHAIAHGYVGERGWRHGIFEYISNNADLPEWEAILYAGIGHIAAAALDEF